MVNKTVRYILKGDVKVYGENPECTIVKEIHLQPYQQIYLDILEKNDFSYKVRMFIPTNSVIHFIPDINIVVGYISHKFENRIGFSDDDELMNQLLDGRYNSDKII